MNIASAPAVGGESKDVYRGCTYCRIHVHRCIFLVHPLKDARLGMYIGGAPTVRCESKDVYRWSAPYRVRV